MPRVLVVEDEQHLANGLRFNLEAEGFDVEVTDTGEAALQRVTEDTPPFDLVLLDVMLPGITGFEVARQLRQQGHFVPVLMLTARGRPDDVLSGFEAGADDYLPKPFELSILFARIRGLLRRKQWLTAPKPVEDPPAPPDRFVFAGKTIDFNALELRVDDKVYQLTLMEANLLRYLIQHQGRSVSRKQILDEVWGVHEDTDTRAIDNFIVRLRRHIEPEPSKPVHLLTVRGVGYRFLAEGK